MPVWLFDRGNEPAVYGIPAFDGMGAPHGLKVGLHGRGPRVRPEAISAPVDEAIVGETIAATMAMVSGPLHPMFPLIPIIGIIGQLAGRLRADGVPGAIVGRALYEGKFTLREALAC